MSRSPQETELLETIARALAAAALRRIREERQQEAA